MRAILLNYTPEPERTVAMAARLCYSDKGVEEVAEELSNSEAARLIKNLAEMGHDSPLEHVSFTFGVEGVSRSMLAQITRHRIASFSVQSQRYVRLTDAKFVTPPSIADNPILNSGYESLMEELLGIYRSLSEVLEDQNRADLKDTGATEEFAQKAAEKLANEDARFVLPNACTTKFIMTMNARSLKHFFSLRCCNRAQWEIRALAEELFRLVYPIAPTIFENAGPSCVSEGICREKGLSCWKGPQVRERFRELKRETKHLHRQ